MPNETPTWSRRDGVWRAHFTGGFTAVVEETADGDGHTWAVYGPDSSWDYGDTPESCGVEVNRAAAQDAAADYAATIAEICAAEATSA